MGMTLFAVKPAIMGGLLRMRIFYMASGMNMGKGQEKRWL